MTSRIVAQSNNPQEPSRSVNNPPSKMQIIRSSVQDSAISTVTKHPILTSGTVVLGAAVANWLSCGAGIALTLLLGGYLVHREYSSPEQFAQRLGEECKGLSPQKAINLIAQHSAKLPAPVLRQLVATLVENHWGKLGLPDYCNNADNKQFLAEKLFSVLNNRNNSTDQKRGICINVVNNFGHLIQNCHGRIGEDLQTGEFQRTFGLSSHCAVSRIEILGDETHNKGAVPILIEVKDLETNETKKIVYKPRSTLPEQALYGQEGLFVSLGGQTYGVLSREGYGYCEFLENREDENTFDSPQEVQGYARSLIILDRVGQRLGLSDLHSENIITSRKFPFVIDAETILLPTRNEAYKTELLSGPRAGYMFDAKFTKNVIWSSFTRDTDFILAQAKEEQNRDEDGSIGRFVEHHTEQIELCRHRLSTENHRIVIIATDDLKAQFKDGLTRGREQFIESLRPRLEGWGFTPNEGIWQAVGEKFTEDFMNNDIPVFYCNPTTGEVFYHDILLGRQPDL